MAPRGDIGALLIAHEAAMPTKQPKPVDREKLVDDLHKAVQAYVEGNGGKAWTIGPIEIIPHRPTQFDVVITCVGERPKT